MKNGCTVLLLSFFIVNCSAWERGQAKTVEQKRDFLLKNGPQFVPGYLSKMPLSVYDLRKQVVNGGGETKEFLHQLVDECYTSHLDYCTVEKYFVAKEKIDKEKERRNKVPVKKGELFYCKVKIHHELGPVVDWPPESPDSWNHLS
ncbi:hypothetical protein [Serratia marcescens]|uniref:hypothetical protein n=1 Tax=Serratia marcescens TaxID=615 RepID=UPI0025AA96FD|nr:hypothetical protein [Serratia marcescens]MDN0031078.1 hypothetical protein [Serratia marcescens]